MILASDQLLTAIVESTHYAIIAKNLDGIILSWNPAAEELFGYAAEEAIGRHIALIVPDEERDLHARNLRRLGRGEKIARHEVVRVRKDGRRLLIALTITPIRDEGGMVVGASAINYNITDRKRVDARVRAEYAVTKILYEARTFNDAVAPILLALCECFDCDLGEYWIVDETGKTLRRLTSVVPGSSPELQEFDDGSRGMIVAPDSLPGRAWRRMAPVWISSFEPEPGFCRRELSERAGLTAAISCPIVSDGVFHGVAIFFGRSPVECDDDYLSLIANIGLKVGHFIRRRQVEQERSDLAAIVEASADAIVGWTVDGRVTSWNRGAENMYGQPAAEAIGQPVLNFVPPDGHEEWSRMFENLLQGNVLEQYETRRLRRDGSLLDVSMTVTPMRNEFGWIVSFSTVARDITAQKREMELQRLAAREQQHRLQNVLAVVSALVHLSRKRARSVDEFANGLTRRIASLGQVYGKLTESGWEHIMLGKLVELCLEPYRGSVDVDGDDIVVSPERAVPLGMVLHELTTNAAKYGALSVASGRVGCRWHVLQNDGAPCLRFHWRETGGPRAKSPASMGMGSFLITQSVETALKGAVVVEYGPGGVSYDISIPWRSD